MSDVVRAQQFREVFTFFSITVLYAFFTPSSRVVREVHKIDSGVSSVLTIH